jgi:tetratricopeptide (TPR) repeat protein
LVAYGLLDSREKKITAQIHRELVNLRNAESKEMQLVVLRHLAELYWEMVYAGLALGDLRTHTLNQALAYADDALKLAQQDTGLQFLKGRILHELKRYEEAQLILESAMSRGLPESRVLPYIVEIAFDRGDYKTVQRLLSRISVSQITPIMKNSINFWVNGRNLNVPLLAKEKFA